MRWALILIAGLSAGCAIKTPVTDAMDVRLQAYLGQAIAPIATALGSPAVQQSDGSLTRYGWRQADLIKPCEVQLWTDSDGRVRKIRWEGYERSCKPLLEQLP